MRYDAILLAVSFGAVLSYMYIAQRERLRTTRRAVFDGCLGVVEEVRVQQTGSDYPMLHGRYRGLDVVIEPVVDQVTFRKLPQLLAIVTLRTAVPCGAVVDAVARPQNTEFYSPWNRLRDQVEPDAGWPAHVLVRTDARHRLPPRESIDRTMRLFDDPRMKEVLISPRGVRLVYQLQEGDRARYLTLRQASFDRVRIDALLAEHLLKRLVGVYEDLSIADGRRAALSGSPRSRA
jgi:hypothetical protein